MGQNSNLNKTDDLICYHCGDVCRDISINKEDKLFCCQSCKLVYEILEENKLCKYYDLESSPGTSPAVRNAVKFEYLEDEHVKRQLIDFDNGSISAVSFQIPRMHCSSCIWLLENLYKVNPGITHSQVDFLRKKLTVKFLNEKTTLRKIAELLDSLGYEPFINLAAAERNFLKKSKKSSAGNYPEMNDPEGTPGQDSGQVLKKLYYKVGIAGFAFGNVMLLSFPEYFGLERLTDPGFHRFFGMMNLILSLPVFFYSSSEYYISAWKGLRNKVINIDFPLFLGILVLFIRSTYEVVTQTGAGYFDSLTGLVFFLLIGKVFQSKTYDAMSFDRTYKSYFPLSAAVIKAGKETTIPVSKLKTGDRIVIRNNELIPADAILFLGDANIDYSFVTGESLPVQKVLGEIIYAGGRQIGGAIELEVLKDISQSYLTQLWNNDAFAKDDVSKLQSFSNNISKYFTLVVLILATGSAAYWITYSLDMAVNVFTAVLIVACPCALALAIPFTLGNVMRIFGRNGFYIKNASVTERLSKITSVVFDKTGTITQNFLQGGKSEISFIGDELTDFELSLVKTLVRQSTHPLSRKIYEHLAAYKVFEMQDFSEKTGQGITGLVLNNLVTVGSPEFIKGKIGESSNRLFGNSSHVYLSVNNKVKGFFTISNAYRQGLAEVISGLEKNYDLHLLSGDNEGERVFLQSYFKDPLQMHFRQSPENKLKYIKAMQNEGLNVLMIGDGLNDAGALKQSDVGISVSEDVSNFSPACDAILDSADFPKLRDFVSFSKQSIRVIIISFAISFLYNIFVLLFALEGLLKPIIAAILMPVSSISVVVFCVIATNYLAKKHKFR